MAPAKHTKSPAFQFYPKDFLSSTKVDSMSMTERGIYITLLSRCWLDNGLPADMIALARMARMKHQLFERLWTKGPLHECFYEKGGRFYNERLDLERRAQADYRKKQKDKADKRWQSHGNATAMPDTGTRHDPGNALHLQSATASALKEKDISAEPRGDSSPVVLEFPVVGNPKEPLWALRQSLIDRWTEAYPFLNVQAECRKALAWAEANPSRRKTGKGMPAFLVNWLNSAVSRGAGHVPSVQSKTAGNVEALKRFIARGES